MANCRSCFSVGLKVLNKSFHSSCPRLRHVRHGEMLQSNKSYSLGKYLFLSIPATTFGLGVWQVSRLQWKENLIADLQRKTNLPTIDLPQDLSELSQLEYRRVRVRGHFDHSREVYLGPRSLLKGGDSPSTGSLISQGSGGQSGFYVITPFVLAERNLEILVNRGWVSREKMHPSSRQEGQISHDIEIEGIVRHSEGRSAFIPKYRGGDVWSYRDLDEMASALRTSPVYLDSCVDSDIPGGPIGGQTRITLRNEHLSYILTWFGISVGSSAVWWKMFKK